MHNAPTIPATLLTLTIAAALTCAGLSLWHGYTPLPRPVARVLALLAWGCALALVALP